MYEERMGGHACCTFREGPLWVLGEGNFAVDAMRYQVLFTRAGIGRIVMYFICYRLLTYIRLPATFKAISSRWYRGKTYMCVCMCI